MKLTLGEGRNMAMGLQEILQRKLPVKTAYWFARSMRELSGDMADFEKARMQLVEKYAKKDKKGKYIEKNGVYEMKDQKEFDKEFNGLADQEISIKFNGVTLEQLGENESCPHCKKEIPGKVIEGQILFNLGKLILDPTDGEKPRDGEKAT